MITNSKIKQIPITEARRNLTVIVEKIKSDELIVFVKNYQPKAVLLNPAWFDQFPSLMWIREEIWGTNSQELGDALETLSKQPKNLLPKLLRS